MVWIVLFAVLLIALFGRSEWQRRSLVRQVLARGWTIDSRRVPGVPDVLSETNFRPLAVGSDHVVHHSMLIEGVHEDRPFLCFHAHSRRTSGKVSDQSIGTIVACRLPEDSAEQTSFQVAPRDAVSDVFEKMSRQINEQSGFVGRSTESEFDRAFYFWTLKDDPLPSSTSWRQSLVQHPQQMRVGKWHISVGASGRWAFLTNTHLSRLEDLDALLDRLSWWRLVLASG